MVIPYDVAAAKCRNRDQAFFFFCGQSRYLFSWMLRILNDSWDDNLNYFADLFLRDYFPNPFRIHRKYFYLTLWKNFMIFPSRSICFHRIQIRFWHFLWITLFLSLSCMKISLRSVRKSRKNQHMKMAGLCQHCCRRYSTRGSAPRKSYRCLLPVRRRCSCL